MDTIFLKTLLMFILSFVIAMVVALLIYWIRKLLTSVRVNSLFNEDSKIKVRRARHIHKIHEAEINKISIDFEQKSYPELFDFYLGITENEPEEDSYYNRFKPLKIRKKKIKTEKKRSFFSRKPTK